MIFEERNAPCTKQASYNMERKFMFEGKRKRN